MTQFRIDVVVDPRRAVAGTQRVERSLTDLERRANRTQNQVATLFRQAFGALTIGFAVRELTLLADSFTQLQNRLRVVTDGQADLTRTTEALLQVSNRSRSSFQSTAELYSRLALSTRELSINGDELLGITESINKAIILSGASAKEANNGLIQLSQGLASGRLTGDELRSTLEQLPVVADVIAKQLGVTRGELRELGAQGEITSRQIILAFQNSQAEIEENFAKTIPTLTQAFVVLRNNVQAFLGELNEGTGFLRAIGASIIFVSENIETLARSITLLAATLVAVRFAPFIQRLVDVNRAVAEGRAVRLGSIAAINMQNAALAREAAANVVTLQAERARIQGVIVATRQEVVHNNAIVGKNAAILALGATEQRLIPVRAQLAAVTNQLAAAETRSAAANATAAMSVTFLSQAFTRGRSAVTGFTAAIAANPVGALVVAITAGVGALVVFRNEISLTEDGLATLGDLFAEFFDQLSGALGIIPDLFRRAFGPAIDVIIDFINDFDIQFRDIPLLIASVLDSVVGLFVGLFNGTVSLFARLPGAIASGFITAVNTIIDTIEFIPDVLIGILRTVGQVVETFVRGQVSALTFLGIAAQQALAGNFEAAQEAAEMAAFATANAFRQATTGLGARLAENIGQELEDELIPRVENPFDGAGGDAADAFLNSFRDGIQASPVTDFVLGLLTGAEQRAQDREGAAATQAKAEADRAAAQAARERSDALQALLFPLEREGVLLSIVATEGQREADIQATLVDLYKRATDAKISLTDAEKEGIEQQVRGTAELREQVALQQRLIPVTVQLAEQQRIANEAFMSGVITAEQYARALEDIELAAANAGNTINDGLTRFLINARREAMDLATVTEDVLAASFRTVENALVELVTTGEASFKDFARALIAEITRIIVRLLILKAIQAITGTGGLQGTGNFRPEGVEGPLLPDGSFAEGGIASANRPFLVGEEGPEIFTPGQTGSITPTDQTIEALRGGAGGGGGTTVVMAPPAQVEVTPIVIDDPSRVSDFLSSREGEQQVLSIIDNNRSNIKRKLG